MSLLIAVGLALLLMAVILVGHSYCGSIFDIIY